MLVAVTTRPHWLIGPAGRIRIFSSTSALTMAWAWWESGESPELDTLACRAVAEKLLDNSDRTVVGLGDIPEVGEALCVAVSRVPWAREETTGDPCR